MTDVATQAKAIAFLWHRRPGQGLFYEIPKGIGQQLEAQIGFLSWKDFSIIADILGGRKAASGALAQQRGHRGSLEPMSSRPGRATSPGPRRPGREACPHAPSRSNGAAPPPPSGLIDSSGPGWPGAASQAFGDLDSPPRT
eukprot:CAMPEP_0117660896 /NCGR_PEP_ID=MMETSP0804-20121206/7230_1 /TAXON_ID=1074897 /ORGANISM="Tetraselmis astigmatica, Strain CCMP880" /LENGTH=140 /DNA_ID=CAMNT_0005467691 /DNA_START=1118 /DNA_END=1542 /DNA_ORIENTATION=+